MDQQDVRSWLDAHFQAGDWDRGISKDDLIRITQDDERVRLLFDKFAGDRVFRSPDEVLQLIPQQAWQDLQAQVQEVAEPGARRTADAPSHFQEGPVGQDQSDVGTGGDATPPPTPGFGQSAGAQGQGDQTS